MRPIALAVVGCGVAGQQHVAALSGVDCAEIRWLCDLDNSAVERLAERYGIGHTTGELENVLADPHVDGVVIATPPATHQRVAIAALDAGKHVLIEKPLATRTGDARAILEAARRRPDRVAMDCSARHARLHEKYRRVRALIAAGAVGDVYYVHHRAVRRRLRPGLEYQPTSPWFGNRAVAGGGPLLDFGVYDLAFHFGVLGQRPHAAQLLALTRGGLDGLSRDRADFDVEEHGVVTMRLHSGALYHWERATNAHSSDDDVTRIYGTKGGIEVNYPSWCPGVLACYRADREDPEIEVLATNPERAAWDDFVRMDEHFVRCVVSGERPAVLLQDAVAALEIVLTVYGNGSATMIENHTS